MKQRKGFVRLPVVSQLALFLIVALHLQLAPAASPVTAASFEGCTLGYWKQSQHLDSWTDPYDPTDIVRVVFDVSPFLSNGRLDLNGDGKDDTLLDALNFQGGSGTGGAARILLQAATAALLNSAHPDVNYPLATAVVISQVNTALSSNNRSTMLELASSLVGFNNSGCPLS